MTMESKGDSVYQKFDMPPREVVALYELLINHSIPAWLDGGWAVDALAKQQTRPHQDVDFLVPIQYTNKLLNIFHVRGFTVDEKETELPYRLVVLNQKESLMIDFHLVIPQDDGSMIFRITNYKENIPSYDHRYLKVGLGGIGVVDGVNIPCITLDEQVRCRTTRKYSFEDPDRQRQGGINADIHDLEIIKKLQNELL